MALKFGVNKDSTRANGESVISKETSITRCESINAAAAAARWR